MILIVFPWLFVRAEVQTDIVVHSSEKKAFELKLSTREKLHERHKKWLVTRKKSIPLKSPSEFEYNSLFSLRIALEKARSRVERESHLTFQTHKKYRMTNNVVIEEKTGMKYW